MQINNSGNDLELQYAVKVMQLQKKAMEQNGQAALKLIESSAQKNQLAPRPKQGVGAHLNITI